MKLASILDLDAPLPSDPFEALVRIRTKLEALNKTTVDTMSGLYPDYVQVVDYLSDVEQRLSVALGSFSITTEVA